MYVCTLFYLTGHDPIRPHTDLKLVMVEFKQPLDLVRVIVLDGRLQHHRLAAQVVDGRGQAVERDRERYIKREVRVAGRKKRGEMIPKGIWH